MHFHFLEVDSFVLSLSTNDIFEDLQNLNDLFDISNLNKSHGLLSDKNKKILSKLKIDAPKYIRVEEILRLRSETYSFKSSDKNTNKLKGISK